MNKITALAFSLLFPLASVEASELKSYEMPRTQVVSIQDTKLGRPYELYIKLHRNKYQTRMAKQVVECYV